MTRHSDCWKLLSASANAVIPSRWNILWNYIIRRKPLNYTLEAWVSKGSYIDSARLSVQWGSSEPLEEEKSGRTSNRKTISTSKET